MYSVLEQNPTRIEQISTNRQMNTDKHKRDKILNTAIPSSFDEQKDSSAVSGSEAFTCIS